MFNSMEADTTRVWGRIAYSQMSKWKNMPSGYKGKYVIEEVFLRPRRDLETLGKNSLLSS
jgi:hypothetical protein